MSWLAAGPVECPVTAVVVVVVVVQQDSYITREGLHVGQRSVCFGSDKHWGEVDCVGGMNGAGSCDFFYCRCVLLLSRRLAGAFSQRGDGTF